MHNVNINQLALLQRYTHSVHDILLLLLLLLSIVRLGTFARFRWLYLVWSDDCILVNHAMKRFSETCTVLSLSADRLYIHTYGCNVSCVHCAETRTKWELLLQPEHHVSDLGTNKES